MIRKIIRFIKRNFNFIYRKYFCSNKNYYTLLSMVKTYNIWFLGSSHFDNIGDMAISEVAIKYIKDKFPKYNILDIRICDYYVYEKAILNLIKPNDIIILLGGGNMGLMYFEIEKMRRRIINKFNNNRIIILPSSIYYCDTNRGRYEFNKSIKIYNKHKDLIICAREKNSYKIMKEVYNNVILVPDIVLYMNKKNYNYKRDKVIIAFRNDKERTNDSIKLYNYLINKYDCYCTDNLDKNKIVSIEMREGIINNKLKELSKGKIVITDRLHIMIFCYLTMTPCLFIDNSYKKVSGSFNLWIKDKCNYIRMIDFNRNIDNQIDKLINVKNKKYYKFNSEFNKLEKYF